MTPWKPKAPSDVVTYSVDWSEALGFAADPSSVVVSAIGATVDSYRQVGPLTYITVSGGTDQSVATVTFNIDFPVINGNPAQSFTRDLSLVIGETTESVTPTTATKRALCEMVFEEIGLSDYEFNVTPEEYKSCMRRMDALANEWRSPGVGIDFGYNFPAILGQGDLEDVSGIPDEAVNALILATAIRVMPIFGKVASPETSKAAAQALVALKATYAKRPQMALPRRTIRGAGNKWSVWNPFMYGGSGN